MTINTVTDILIAVLTTVGIAVAVSLAFVLAGAYFERGQARTRTAVQAVPAQHPTQTDDARELVLR